MFPLNINPNGDMEMKSVDVGKGTLVSKTSGKIHIGDIASVDNELPIFSSSSYIRDGNIITVITVSAHGFMVGTVVVFTDSTGGIRDGSYVVNGIISSTRFTVLDSETGSIGGTTDIYKEKVQIGNSGDDIANRETRLSIYANNSYPQLIGNNESTIVVSNNKVISGISYVILDSVMTITLDNHGFGSGDIIGINHPIIKAVSGVITRINSNIFTMVVNISYELSGNDMALDDGCSINFGSTNLNGVCIPESRIKATQNSFEVECYRPTNRDILCTYQQNKYETGISIVRGTPATVRNIGFDVELTALAYSGSEFVGLFDNSAYLSSDGVNWIRRIIISTTHTWSDLIYVDNGYIGVSDIIVVSRDALTWVTRTSPNLLYKGISYNDNIYVAVGSLGIATSSDTVTWVQRNQSFSRSYTGIVFGSNIFVASTTSGLVYSTDGITWSLSNITSNVYMGVTFGNGIYVAVPDNGTILVSTNGQFWSSELVFFEPSSELPPDQYSYKRVKFGDGLYVASTSNGVRISVDSVTWEDKIFTTPVLTIPIIPPPPENPNSGVAFGNNTFIISGMGGRIVSFRTILNNSISIDIPDTNIIIPPKTTKLYLDILAGEGESKVYDISQVSTGLSSTEIILFDSLKPIVGRNIGSGSVSLIQKYRRVGNLYTITLFRLIPTEYSGISVGDVIYVSFIDASDPIPVSSSFVVKTISTFVNSKTISFDGHPGPNVVNKECILVRGGFQSRFNMYPDGRVGFNIIPRMSMGMDIYGDIKIGQGIYVKTNIQSLFQLHDSSGDFVISEEGRALDIFTPSNNQCEAWMYTLENVSKNSVITAVSFDNFNNSCISGSVLVGGESGLFKGGDITNRVGVNPSVPSLPTNERGVVYKLDKFGNLIWSVLIFSQTGDVIVSSIIEKTNGNVYVVVKSTSSEYVIQGPHLQQDIIYSSSSKTLLIRFDTNGFPLSTVRFESNNEIHPMGLDISSGTHLSVAFAGISRISVFNQINNLRLSKYHIPTDPDISSGGLYKVTILKLSTDLSSVSAETSFSTNIASLEDLGFINSGLSSSRLKEGVVRYDNDPNGIVTYITFPANDSVRMYFYEGTEYYEDVNSNLGEVLGVFNGSMCIGMKNSYRISDISLLTSIKRSSSEEGIVVTTSIDVDKGPQGDSVESSVYLCGTCEGAVDFISLIKFGNRFIESNVISSRLSERRGAFVCKLFNTGFLDWFAMIDGNDEEEAVSISVNSDVQESVKGAYGIYVLGSFTSLTANVFDSRRGTLNRADTSISPATRIIKSIENGSGIQRESYILKFDQTGKYLLTFKTSTSERITPIYVDVGPGDNVIACYKTSVVDALFKEPDGRISASIKRPSIRDIGVVVKYRTTNNLVLVPPTSTSVNIRKRIINKSEFSLYIEAYRRDNGSREILSDVFVIPSQTSMVLNYTINDWYSSSSDRLSTGLISLDTDNGKIGFGVEKPKVTFDVSGGINIDGIMTSSLVSVSADMKVGEGITVSNGLSQLEIESSSYLVNGTPFLPIGMVVIWFGNANAIPEGWALCDGGSYNGVNVPDLRGRFVLGYNQVTTFLPNMFDPRFNPTGSSYQALSNTIGETSGEDKSVLLRENIPNHFHNIPFRDQGNNFFASNSNQGSESFFSEYTENTASTGSTVVNHPIFGEIISIPRHNNMPPYYSLMYICKI